MRRTALLICVLLISTLPHLSGDALEEAAKLEGTGVYVKAAAEYRALVAKEKQPGKATLRLIRLYRLTGKHDAAAKLIAKGVALAGKPAAPFMVEAGELALDTGRHDEARKQFTAAAGRDRLMIEPQVGLGRLDQAVGRIARAQKRFDQIFDDYDPTARQYTSRELVYLAIGIRELAMRSSEVDRTETLRRLINQILPEAFRADKYNHMARWLRGSILLDAYQTSHAKKNFTDALKINPRHPWLRAGLGMVYAQSYGTLKKAPEEFHRALKVNPKLVDAHEALASLYLNDELYAKADRHIKRALAVNPKRLSTLAVRAGYHLLRHEKPAYEKLEKQVLAINPKYGDFYYICSGVIGAQRQFEMGAKLCRKALDLDPKLWHAWISLASNLLRIGKEDEAKKALEVVKKEYFFHVQSRNYLMLLESYNEYIVKKTDHFRIRLHVSENAVLRTLISEFLEGAHKTLSERYGFEPEGPILFEMFDNMDDFAVRTIGLSGLGALGACFGKVVTMISPKGFGRPFNWSATAWHEFAHVVTLQLSGMRVPRWFTEGLSEYEEYVRDKASVRPMHHLLYSAYTRGAMRGIRTFNAGFSRPKYGGEVGVCYFQGGLLCRYIAETFGFKKIPQMLRLYAKGKKTPEVIREALGLSLDEFDKQSLAYIKKHVFSKIQVLPSFSEDQLEDLKDELEDEPDDLEIREKLALAYFARRMLSDAEMKAGQVLKRNPKALRAHLVLGRINYGRKNWVKAKHHFETALKLGAKDFHAHLLLGHLYKNVDKNQEMATEQWVKAKSCNPFYIGKGSPYHLLAVVYKKQGKFDKWIAELEGVIHQSGDNIKNRMEVAKYYQEQKNHLKATRYLTEVVNINPFLPEPEIMLGMNLVLLKKYQRALLHLQIAQQLKPKNQMHRIYTGLAESYYGLDQLAKARIMVREALALKPNYARAKRLLEKLSR